MILSTSCLAVEVLRAADEGILWTWRPDAGDSERGTLTKKIGGTFVEQRMLKSDIHIVYHNGVQPKKSQALEVGPSVSLLTARPKDTPKEQPAATEEIVPPTVEEENNDEAAKLADKATPAEDEEIVPPYIEEENNNEAVNLVDWAQRKEPRRSWYKPDMTTTSRAHQALVFGYLEALDACIDDVKTQLNIEASANANDTYNNNAYLSEALKAIEQCYDDIGSDIIDDFYNGNPDAWKEYNRRVQAFHVNSHDVLYNPEYCGNGPCSEQAIADLQMDKFDGYKGYLTELIEKAPDNRFAENNDKTQHVTVISPEIRVPAAQIVAMPQNQAYISYPAANELPVSATVYQNGQYWTVNSDGRTNTHEPIRPQSKRRIPKTIRIQKPNGEEEIVRWHPNPDSKGKQDVYVEPVNEYDAPLYQEVNRQAFPVNPGRTEAYIDEPPAEYEPSVYQEINRQSAPAYPPYRREPIIRDYDGVPMIDEEEL